MKCINKFAMPPSDQTIETRKFSDSLLWRRLKIITWLVLLSLGGMWGFLWYQDGPLREAQQLLSENDPSQALSVVDGWQSDHGITDTSQALRARCLVGLGRYPAAIQIFETVGANSVDELHAWASAHLHLEQWSNAVPLLELAREKQPSNVDILHELAACQAKLGRLNDAIETAQEFTEKSPNPHRGLLLLGVLYQQQGNKQQAAAAWQKIAETDPEFADLQIPPEDILLQIASLELELGHLEIARELLQKSIGHKQSAIAFYQLGSVEDQLGNQSAAEAAWSKSFELDPTPVHTREALARIAITKGETDQAESLLQPLLEQPNLKSSTTYLMERVAQRRKDPESIQKWHDLTETLRTREQIESTMTQIVRDNPNTYWGLVVRCYDFARNGNWHQAEEMIDSIPVQDMEHQFVVQLREAIRQQSQVPSIELLPVTNF